MKLVKLILDPLVFGKEHLFLLVELFVFRPEPFINRLKVVDASFPIFDLVQLLEYLIKVLLHQVSSLHFNTYLLLQIMLLLY